MIKNWLNWRLCYFKCPLLPLHCFSQMNGVIPKCFVLFLYFPCWHNNILLQQWITFLLNQTPSLTPFWMSVSSYLTLEMCCGEYNTAFYAFSWSGWRGVLSFLGTRTSFFSKYFQIQHFFIDFSIAEWMWKHMCVFPESCDHVRMIVFMCCAPMKATTIIKFTSRMLYINFTDISVKPKTQNNALHNYEIPSY